PHQKRRTSAASKRFVSLGRLRARSLARGVIDFFRGIEIENFLTLSRTWVDGAHVLAALHFPNRGDHAVFLDGLISNFFFRGCLRGRLGLRRLVFCHESLNCSSCLCGFVVSGILSQRINGCLERV